MARMAMISPYAHNSVCTKNELGNVFTMLNNQEEFQMEGNWQ